MTIFNVESIHQKYDPFFLGFNRLFKELETFNPGSKPNYPPYNVIKSDNGCLGRQDFIIEIALAGFTESEISVLYEVGKLTVKGNKDRHDGEYLHKGIASRTFENEWKLANTIEIKDAVFRDGVLTINLLNVIPESKKPQEIPISTEKTVLNG